jgi:hypothetical protein
MFPVKLPMPAVFVCLMFCIFVVSGNTAGQERVHAQVRIASPSAIPYIYIPPDPTPLIMNREPEFSISETPEIPLVTYLRKFLYMLADIVGITLPGKEPRT